MGKQRFARSRDEKEKAISPIREKARDRTPMKLMSRSKARIALAAVLMMLAGCSDERVLIEPSTLYDQGVVAYLNEEDAEAARLFQLAAEQGNAKATALLGLMYLSGEGVPVDVDEAIRWLGAAAEQGDADGQYYFGFLSVMEGLREGAEALEDADVERSLRDMLRWSKLASDQGHTQALLLIGETYFFNCWRSEQTALPPTPSGFDLVDDCLNGFRHIYDEIGLPTTLAELENMYVQAADPGGAKGLVKLGDRFRFGLHIPENAAEAVRLYKLAADRGNADGQMALATMYRLGDGVPKNEAQALSWYRHAAAQGDANGQFRVAAMLHDGKGVPRNGAEAVRFYELAAAQGNSNSMAMLARMYRYGEGVPKNNILAYKWYNITSAFDNDPFAGAERDALARTMSPDQIAEAQRFSSEWQPPAPPRALTTLIAHD